MDACVGLRAPLASIYNYHHDELHVSSMVPPVTTSPIASPVGHSFQVVPPSLNKHDTNSSSDDTMLFAGEKSIELNSQGENYSTYGTPTPRSILETASVPGKSSSELDFTAVGVNSASAVKDGDLRSSHNHQASRGDMSTHQNHHLMINFCALRSYVQLLKGIYFETPNIEGTKELLFILNDDPKTFIGTQLEWKDSMMTFTPHGFDVLKTGMINMAHEVSLRCALSVLRLSDHDPRVLYEFRNFLLKNITDCPAQYSDDLYLDLQRVTENIDPVNPAKDDVYFVIGRILMGLERRLEAIDFFKLSIAHFGPHYIALYNIGLCYALERQYKNGLDWFSKANDANPDFFDGRVWQGRMEQKLQISSSKEIEPSLSMIKMRQIE
eukprot:TRINITY_DN3640_c0_g1_i1.p1 TRINITY_DN3640_c0_g1~~TRINITY_DN3640_c0_g1_i1.p1  ORF type:complete len:382 (+),score=73.19 TRINITY_DN3640_c0_g1_i1:1033-2178(+)